MKIKACAHSDQGPFREKNEDAFEILEKENFYLLADGVGGRNSGEIASADALQHMSFIFKRQHELFREADTSQIANFIKHAIIETNFIICKKSLTYKECSGMATTICCAFIKNQKFIYAHLGDSRIYRLRKDELTQLTQDHTVAERLREAGEAVEYPVQQENMITQGIGLNIKVDPIVKIERIEDGDIYLLASDGVNEGLSDQEVKEILMQKKTLKSLCEEIIAKSRKKDAQDNITLIIIKTSN